MAKKTIDQVEVAGRRVLMRVDFNVPLDEAGAISDDRRIRLALPTLRSVIDRGGRLVLMTHLGRPKGRGPEAAFGLGPVAGRLGELLPGTTVRFAPGECTGDSVADAVRALGDGEVLLLDNLRFSAGEKKGDAAFAQTLAEYGDLYCNDAFGTAHRADASMLAVPRAMDGCPRVCGFLLEKELRFLSEAIDAAAPGGFVAVLGGAKVSDKLGAIRNLTGRVGHIVVGGAMAYTFLRARGVATGRSLVEDDMVGEAETMLETARAAGTEILLPDDHVCGREAARGTDIERFEGDIGEGWMGLDIGPGSAERFAAVVRDGSTVVWNGPLGLFEIEPFDAGSRVVAGAVAEATGNGAVTVIGGGDTAAAIEAFGLASRVSHVSTGGGASLQMLEGRSFETVELLDEA